MSSALKPAVRADTDANSAFSSLSPRPIGPSVAGFDHSKTSRAAAPPTSSTALPLSVSLVCSDQRCGSRRFARMSCSTGKPMPPTRMPSTTRATPETSPSPMVWVSAWVSMRVRSRGERLTVRPSSAVAVISPKPPSWNRPITTTWPKVDQ